MALRYGLRVPKGERLVFRVEDGDGNQLHAVWSRSGKHLIVTIFRPRPWESMGQVELSHDQLEKLSAFLVETTPQ